MLRYGRILRGECIMYEKHHGSGKGTDGGREHKYHRLTISCRYSVDE